jgi:hypothetical protein
LRKPGRRRWMTNSVAARGRLVTDTHAPAGSTAVFIESYFRIEEHDARVLATRGRLCHGLQRNFEASAPKVPRQMASLARDQLNGWRLSLERVAA